MAGHKSVAAAQSITRIITMFYQTFLQTMRTAEILGELFPLPSFEHHPVLRVFSVGVQRPSHGSVVECGIRRDGLKA